MFKRIALLFVLLLVSLPAFAATTPNTFVSAITPNRGQTQFTSSTTPGTYLTTYTAGTNGSKVVALYVSNNDSSATHVVTCGLFNAATQYASWTVTTTSPTAGLYINLPMLTSWLGLPMDSDGNPYITMISGDTLQCTYATAVTAAKFVVVHAIVADY